MFPFYFPMIWATLKGNRNYKFACQMWENVYIIFECWVCSNIIISAMTRSKLRFLAWNPSCREGKLMRFSAFRKKSTQDGKNKNKR